MTGPSRSSEEFAMRSAVEKWGRPRWPGAPCHADVLLETANAPIACDGVKETI